MTEEWRTPRTRILEEATRLISADRNNSYGPPTQDFERTAQLWGAYTGYLFSAHDVAVMQILLKVSRISWSAEKRDNWVDIAGYAGCGGECAGV